MFKQLVLTDNYAAEIAGFVINSDDYCKRWDIRLEYKLRDK